MPKNTIKVQLIPQQDVARTNSEDVALSATPWMRLEPIGEVLKHRWIKIEYRSSIFDDPVRPLIRFNISDGSEVWRIMNGPVMGTARWIDRIPDGTEAIWISPTNSPGPFRFQVDEIRGASRARVLIDSLRADTSRTTRSLLLRLVKEHEEARRDVKQALGFVPLQNYASWAALRMRELDLTGIDRPRTDWRLAPSVRLLMPLDGVGANALERTLSSLRRQVCPNWTLHAVQTSSPNEIAASYERHAQADARYLIARPAERLDQLSVATREDDLLAVVRPGDMLPEYAVAVLLEAAAANPGWRVVYGDEDAIDEIGHLHSPVFKPSSAPWPQSMTGDAGPFELIRLAILRTACHTIGEALTWQAALSRKPQDIPNAGAVGHIRRVLYRRYARTPASPVADFKLSTSPDPRDPERWPSVTIVIPTRNRANLLTKCLRGIDHLTDYASKHVVIVDNGSTSPDALRLLNDLRGRDRVSVLRHPGSFNFSDLCNKGAAISQAEVLVFLNNDVSITEPGWLKSLVRWAICPNVGAVGAKLLLPNGKIQHAGAVLGLQGYAGHPYYGAASEERGFLDQLHTAREVMAVTGACLAVERKKFNAVGGFDADNLPVLLNDTDLCLRLRERGWASMWTPHAVLYHRESSTRGHDHNTSERHRAERTYFMKKWSHWVRDDPYFHPAFSLLSHSIGLG